MSEKNMWNHLRKKMVPQFWAEATRHEDAYQRGIADVSFVHRKEVDVREVYDDGTETKLKGWQEPRHGWVELKHKGMAPVRPTTICKIKHFTDDQRIWLKSKGDAGGMTFLLLQLGRSWMLFDHVQCQDVGKVTSRDLIDLSCWYSDGLDPRGLWEAINEHG
jgi:hypothetical protein